MKIDVPAEMFGGNPAGLIDHCGLYVATDPNAIQRKLLSRLLR